MYSPNRLIFNIPPPPLHRAKIDSKCWVPGLSYFYCFETPVLWPPHAKSWLIGKDSDAGRDWGQEEKGTTEDEMVGWHHWLDGRRVWVNSGSWWWTGRPGVLRFMGSQSRTQLSDWTELNWRYTRKIKNNMEWPVKNEILNDTILEKYFEHW